MIRRASFSFILSVSFAAALAAGTALAQQPRKGGNLVYANVSGLGTQDPHVAAAVVELEPINHIFEGLVAMGEDYEAKPSIASKWEVTPDARTFTFTLRRGVKFHNGKELTSADVLASFQRYQQLSPNKAQLANVEAFEVPDAHTFVIKLKAPNAVFVEVLKTPTYPFSILPAEQKDKAAREVDVIGTGPFKLGEWVRDSHLTMRRNDDYSIDTARPGIDGLAGRKTVHLDSVRYNFVPEANARVAALQSGGADYISNIPPDTAKRIGGQPNVNVVKVIPFCQQTFVLHTQAAPTSNVLIRQAIQAVFDVDDMIAVSSPDAERNPAMVFKTSPYYQPEVAAKYYDIKNQAKAKALLQQAGYKGEKIVLQTNASYSYMRDSIVFLVEAMKAAGMNPEVSMVDWPTNASNMQSGNGGWNVSVTGFCSGPLLGPQQWRPLLVGFPQVKGDTILDQAYDKFFTSVDIAKRKEAWLAIEQRVLDQAYMIKVSDMPDLRAHNGKFEGLKPYYFTRFWDVWQK
ncbi:MAG: ABC transporter substrate-binding protein [Alphaproteobacteria bacterium]|nr:ABC transporter substrate-binding protein [Alphaproteobacteria bacterium]